MPGIVFFELSPLTISLVFAWFADDDIVSSTAILFGGFGTFLVFLGLRMYHSKAFDDSPDYDHAIVQALDIEHLQERYALITLIFLGELCFAAASKSGAYYQSLLALLAAIGGFLLYFIARVEGRTEAAMRSAQRSIHSQHLHLLLFGTIPIMGVAYVKQMEQLVEKEADDISQFHDSGVILGISSGVFLLITGLLELLTKDPELQKDQPRIQHTIRVTLQIGMGIFVAALASFSNFGGTVVSFSMFLTASVLVWGCQNDEIVL
jgi:low temperature requirement protein LtrA